MTSLSYLTFAILNLLDFLWQLSSEMDLYLTKTKVFHLGSCAEHLDKLWCPTTKGRRLTAQCIATLVNLLGGAFLGIASSFLCQQTNGVKVTTLMINIVGVGTWWRPLLTCYGTFKFYKTATIIIHIHTYIASTPPWLRFSPYTIHIIPSLFYRPTVQLVHRVVGILHSGGD